MARVCIITPGALGSNPRVVKEATSLADHGFDVTVISTRTMELVDRRDKEILASARWMARRIDARRGPWRRLLRAVQTAAAWAGGLSRSAACAEAAASALTLPLMTAARKVEADLYIAHYVAALPAAAKAARKHGSAYAFDAEDFHLGDPPEGPGGEQARRMTRTIEGRYLPGCAYVTAGSPGIADAYAEAYGIPRPTALLNVFPKHQAPQRPTASGTVAPGPSVYWFSQTIGPDRGLECAVRAIGRAAARPHLSLRGTPAKGFLERLRTLATEAGVDGRVHILPPATPAEMARLAAVHDIGLSGEPGHTPNNRIALGNKVFTYLLAGIPVVMSDVPAHRALAPALGQAARLYPTEDADGLAARLDELLLDPAGLEKARSEAWRLGQTRYNWDLEQHTLVDLVARVLRRDGSGAARPAIAGDAEC